jgi:predicted AAA+ superfamily ATPase
MGLIMKRFAETYLLEWKNRKRRKPLIIRGARQTGKTYLVEKFAETYSEKFVKVDFEFDVAAHSIFRSKDPTLIKNELSLYFDTDIVEQRTLLFLDEIQACPEAIAALRYFYEKMPDLHVIAAGSLLDFALRDFPYAMPVGRIEFMYLNPMTFEEFLWATTPRLLEYIRQWSLTDQISTALHSKLKGSLRNFFFTGGMPEAVASYARDQNFIEVQRILGAILTTMQNDFAKYGSRKQQIYLQKVMHYVAVNIGRKVKYVNIDRNVRSGFLKEAFHLLAMSKVVHPVARSDGNGLPLGAEASAMVFKPIFLDVGLVNSLCGLKLLNPEALITIHEGGLAEQFIGQELLNLEPFFQDTRLYFWNREEKNSNAELDYLLSHQNSVIPVEVKAGKTGTLKSLHLFLYAKALQFGLRFNMDRPSLGNFSAKVRLRNQEGHLEYTLLSLPLYLVGQTNRILGEIKLPPKP